MLDFGTHTNLQCIHPYSFFERARASFLFFLFIALNLVSVFLGQGFGHEIVGGVLDKTVTLPEIVALVNILHFVASGDLYFVCEFASGLGLNSWDIGNNILSRYYS